MNVLLERRYEDSVVMLHVTYGEMSGVLEAHCPDALNGILLELGVPLVLEPKRGPSIEREGYDACRQCSMFVVKIAGVLFEFEISDREMSTGRDAVTDVIREIASGCYWEDQVEEGTGGEDSGGDNSVPEDEGLVREVDSRESVPERFSGPLRSEETVRDEMDRSEEPEEL